MTSQQIIEMAKEYGATSHYVISETFVDDEPAGLTFTNEQLIAFVNAFVLVSQ
jgi:hypothetical protein